MSESLTTLWAKTRLALIMLADGTTTKPDSDPRGGVPSSRPPAPAGQELAELDYRWAHCRTDEHRRAVIRDALTALVAGRFAPDRSLRRDTEEWRRRIARDARSATVVANVYGVSRTTVYKYRRTGGK